MHNCENKIMACGIDFGTSNSTIGIATSSGVKLIPIDGDANILKSAIFFDIEDNNHFIGQRGIDRYLNGSLGRLMLSLKSILGSSLAAEKIIVCKKNLTYQEIIGLLIKHIKTTAENYLDTELTKVVLGRPVRYHDFDDTKDKLAQSTMQEIAIAQGFTEVEFQFEPIAAALDYEQTIHNEELALIVDIGGGTSDFTITRINGSIKTVDRRLDILANCGVHIGGTDFDRELSLQNIMPLLGKGSFMRSVGGASIEVPSSLYYDLTTWHMLTSLYSTKTINNLKQIYDVAQDKGLIRRALNVLEKQLGHLLLTSTEKAKIMLSKAPDANIDLSIVEQHLSLNVKREQFEENCLKLISKLENTIQNTLNNAGVKACKINSVFLTGGTTNIPLVLSCIRSLFPHAKLVQGDIFGSVGKGLAIEAKNLWAR